MLDLRKFLLQFRSKCLVVILCHSIKYIGAKIATIF
jgi:hypothetical protein